VSNTIGEKSAPIRPQESALSWCFCPPLPLWNIAALPRRGGQWQDSGGPWSGHTPAAGNPLGIGHSGDIHLAGMRDQGLGKDLAEKG